MKLAWELDMVGIKRLGLLVLLLNFISPFMTAVNAAEIEAGKTLLTKGQVTSDRSSGRVVLKRRSVIYEKDEIRVGNDGRAQFRMSDTALISLQENSVLQIKKYQYKAGRNDNSALLELIQGGLRTITGAIGKDNKQAYELLTPLATIGIRGTDYEVEIVANGMYVAVWEGIIRIKSRLKNGCDLLLGKNQPFKYVFIDKLGMCTGLKQVPKVFSEGHSSNIKQPTTPSARGYIVGDAFFRNSTSIEPVSEFNPSNLTAINSFDFSAFVINQSNPSQELTARASQLSTPTPTFAVGLNRLNVINNSVSDYQQSVGGYPVGWGYWGEFSSTLASRNITNSTSTGLIWSTYEATIPDIVSARTGSFERYETINDSLLSGSQGAVTNLAIQMDVNFDTGNVTNGALSANTPNDTWVAVFDGQIQAGDLALQMNGASVIDSNPSTSSIARDADGFIAGDFVGENAEAILGAFGLSETADPSNHIEGVFILEEAVGSNPL